MTESKSGIAIVLNVKLITQEDCSDFGTQTLSYRELIGAFTYLTVATRPVIA